MRRLSGVALVAILGGCSSPPPSGPPPIEIAVRDSVIGRGKVIRLTNVGDKELHLVRLELTGEGKEFKGVIAKVIRQHDTTEIGWTELGFGVFPGMSLRVTCNDYPEAINHEVK
jgi:hypothetical protein